MTQPELPNKENGTECITERKGVIKELTDCMDAVTQSLNTQPLVAIGCRTKSGDRLLLAISLGEERYCPIAVLEPTPRIKELISDIYLRDGYKLVSQTELDAFKGYQEMLKK